MPTVLNPRYNDKDEEQGQPGQPQGQQQPDQGAAPTQPVSLSGGQSSQVAAGPGGAGGANASTPNASNPAGSENKAGSGRYLNLQKYLKANEGVDYAGKIGQSVQNQQNQFNSNLQGTQTGIQNQVNPEIQRLQGAHEQVQQALADPTAYAQNADNLAAFGRLRTGDYLHNVGIGNEADLMSQQGKLQEQASLARSEPGRFQLLKNVIGGPNYNAGQNKLDQLLLQGQSGQLKNLTTSTGNAAQKSQQDLEALRNSVSGYNTQLGTLGTAAQNEAQTGIAGANSGLESDLDTRAQALQQQRAQQYSGLQQALSSGNLTAAQAQQLGIGGSMDLYGLNPQEIAQQYLTSPTGNETVGRGNVANESDINRYNALQQLAGHPELQGNLAHSDLQNPYQFGNQAFQTTLNNRANDYNQGLNNLVTQNQNMFSSNMAGSPQFSHDPVALRSQLQSLANEYSQLSQNNPNGGANGMSYGELAQNFGAQIGQLEQLLGRYGRNPAGQSAGMLNVNG